MSSKPYLAKIRNAHIKFCSLDKLNSHFEALGYLVMFFSLFFSLIGIQPKIEQEVPK